MTRGLNRFETISVALAVIIAAAAGALALASAANTVVFLVSAAALVALAWIGRGDFEPEEWRTAVAEAKQRAEGPTWKYLLGFELLPDYLEDALSAFGRSCEGLGSADEG